MPENRELVFKLDFDTTKLIDGISTLKDNFEINPAGFLIVDMNCTRAGIFDYLGKDGETIREYRSPEEVFSDASMNSLKFAPITAQVHPDAKVDINNVKTLQVGMIGENLKRVTNNQGDFLAGKAIFTDKEEIDRILDRHKKGEDIQVSCGYSCLLTPEKGKIDEGEFDAKQSNIIYNHLATVDKGRAGRHVKLKLDQQWRKDNMPDKTVQITHPAIKLDGFTMDAILVEVPEAQVQTFNGLLSKLDEATKLIQTNLDREQLELSKKAKTATELEAEKDEHKDSLEKAKKDLEAVKTELSDWQNPTSEKVQALIKSRTDLEKVAKALEIKTDGLSDKQIKIEVTKKVHDGLDISDKEEVYIDARYDSCSDLLVQAKKEKGDNALGLLRKDVVDNKTKAGPDPKGLFKRKSDALAQGEDPDKVTE